MIQIDDLQFDYGGDGFCLNIPHITIGPAERVSLIGPSGSGKSTLLSLISGAAIPSRGKIRIDDTWIHALPDSGRRRFRISKIGFVFQDFELIEYLSVAENIRLPYWLNRSLKWDGQAKIRLNQLVEITGLSDKLRRKPEQLSRGERQRVAICRALITNPRIILADEPTASLDAATGGQIIDLLLQQATLNQSLLLLVTHDPAIQQRLDRVVDVSQFSRGRSESEKA